MISRDDRQLKEQVMGKIAAICISEKKGTVKRPVEQAHLIENFGIEGDAHAGNWHRQVSLLSYESVREFEKSLEGKRAIMPGDFGENLLVEGLDLRSVAVGDIVKTGDVTLRITQIGKECHKGCEIRKITGDCIMPREGVFAEVIKGGIVVPGQEVSYDHRR